MCCDILARLDKSTLLCSKCYRAQQMRCVSRRSSRGVDRRRNRNRVECGGFIQSVRRAYVHSVMCKNFRLCVMSYVALYSTYYKIARHSVWYPDELLQRATWHIKMRATNAGETDLATVTLLAACYWMRCTTQSDSPGKPIERIEKSSWHSTCRYCVHAGDSDDKWQIDNPQGGTYVFARDRSFIPAHPLVSFFGNVKYQI